MGHVVSYLGGLGSPAKPNSYFLRCAKKRRWEPQRLVRKPFEKVDASIGINAEANKVVKHTNQPSPLSKDAKQLPKWQSHVASYLALLAVIELLKIKMCV